MHHRKYDWQDMIYDIIYGIITLKGLYQILLYNKAVKYPKINIQVNV
jgi:uncharacterized membrane protein YuzA (DUF378 family)